MLKRISKIVIWILAVIGAAFVVLVIVRMFHFTNLERTNKQVAKIHATKLTLDDVLGKNLPPDPGTEADKTVQGIDANGNGIRDDVELAIFKLHPDSARIRAAELQYAKALQMELTQVFNSKTLVATLQEATRGILCISGTGPKISLSDNHDVIKRALAITDVRQNEVENLVLNNQARKDKREQIFDYMTSHGDIDGPDCDIDPASLPN